MKTPGGKTGIAQLKRLTLDERLQVRVAGVDEEHVDRLAEIAARKKGKKLPKLLVCVVKDPPGYEPGTYSFLVDGFNRLAALRKVGKKTAPALFVHCDWTRAREIAATANTGERALPLKKADRAKSIDILLEEHGDDSERPWSDGRIAYELGVSDETVRLRRKAKNPSPTKTVRREAIDGRMTSSRPAAEAPPGHDDGARELPADKLDVSDHVIAAFRRSNVSTLGQLADLIAQGGDMGLKATEIEDLKEELRQSGVRPRAGRQRPGPEPTKPGDPLFNWKSFDESYGVVARAPDYLMKTYPGLADECRGLIRLLREFRSAWEELRKRITTPEAT